MKVSALLLFCLACMASAVTSPSDNDVSILNKARQDLFTYPEWVQANFTIPTLRRFHNVASIQVVDVAASKAIYSSQRKATPTPAHIVSEMKHSPPPREMVKVNPAEIEAIGKGLWQIVQDNQAVVNYTADWAGAVPAGLSDWTQLSGWKDYISKEYQFIFKNAAGITLSSFNWVFKFNFNGSYQGTGSYVQGLGASVEKVYAYLSEHVDVTCKAFNPINYGSVQAPSGGMDYQVIMVSHGLFEKTQVGCHVIAKGTGELTTVTCDQN